MKWQGLFLNILMKHFICRWKVSNWTTCSKSCGGGIRKRDVACVQVIGTKVVSVNSTACHGEKPKLREKCNNHVCHNHWHKGRYSKVSSYLDEGCT